MHHEPSEMTRDQRSTPSTYVKFQTEKERLDNLAFASFPEDYLPYTSSYHRKAPYLVWDDDVRQHRKSKRKRSPLCSSLTNRCRCCSTAALVTAIVLIVTGILAVVAVSVYLGVLTSFFISPVVSLTGRLRVTDGDDFEPSLLDVSSEDFRTKAASYEVMLHRVYEASALQQALERVKVFAFREGSLNVFFRVHLDRRKVILPDPEIQQLAKDILEKEAVKEQSTFFPDLRIEPESLDVKVGVEDSHWLLLKLSEDLQSTGTVGTTLSTPPSMTPTTTSLPLNDSESTDLPDLPTSSPTLTDILWRSEVPEEEEGGIVNSTAVYDDEDDDSVWQGNESTHHHSSGNLFKFRYGPWRPYHSTQLPITSERVLFSPEQSLHETPLALIHPPTGGAREDGSRSETSTKRASPDGNRFTNKMNVTTPNILQYSPPGPGHVQLRFYDIVTLPSNSESTTTQFTSSTSDRHSSTANSVSDGLVKEPKSLRGISDGRPPAEDSVLSKPSPKDFSTEMPSNEGGRPNFPILNGHSYKEPLEVKGLRPDLSGSGLEGSLENVSLHPSELVHPTPTSSKENLPGIFKDEEHKSTTTTLGQAGLPNHSLSTLDGASSPLSPTFNGNPFLRDTTPENNHTDLGSTTQLPLEPNQSSTVSVSSLDTYSTKGHPLSSESTDGGLQLSTTGHWIVSEVNLSTDTPTKKHDGQTSDILVSHAPTSSTPSTDTQTDPSPVPALPKVVRAYSSDTKSHANSIKTSQDIPDENPNLAIGPLFLIYKPVKPHQEREDADEPKPTVTSISEEKDRNASWTGADRDEVRVPYNENSVSEDPFIGYWNLSPDKELPAACDGFSCSDGHCVPEDARCNRKKDCRDNSDEDNCSCAAYLRALNQPQKVCDGVLDCWDYSDEKQCGWCSPGQTPCFGEKKCINSSQLCDGSYDCLFGTDERYCVRLANDAESANHHTYLEDGYLMVHREGTWGKLCLENLENLADSNELRWKMEELGKAVCNALSYKEMTAVERTVDTRQDSSYFEISPAGSSRRRSITMFQLAECPSKDVVRVSCKSLECGMRPMSFGARRRVVGGESTLFGSWPWQVALYKEGEFQCGAVLINDEWLLSAGHCFFVTRTSHWTARLGMLRRGVELPSPFEVVRKVKHIVIHPDYVDKGFINDIALLKLEEKVPFSDFLRPVCLPEPEEDGKQWAGQACSVVGWGKLFEQGHTFPDTLQEVQLPVIPTQECRKRTVFLPIYKITDNMFCAGYERGGRDACLGDSGGPLMCQRPNGRWVVVGVTSNGDGCGRPNRPGVYTKIANYLTWIDSVIKEGPGSSVETFCAGHRCHLGRCLKLDKVCDGTMDCGDGSDEANCSTTNTHR